MTRNTDRLVIVVLLLGTLAISTAYGMLLLLPLYVKQDLHGTEADFGAISAAGTITAAIAIGLLIRYPRRLAPHQVLAVTAAGYAVAAFLVSLTHAVDWELICLGVLLGTTWAVAYTAAPMVISELSDDQSRAKYIGYATGMVQVGFGLGPIVGNALHDGGVSFQNVFRFAAGLSLLAAAVVLPLDRFAPALVRRPGVADGPPLGRALSSIARSAAVVPLVMILLCSCLFTTMNSFNTTFAASRHLSFDIFYIGYTVSVIFVRFVLVRMFPNPSSPVVLAVASSGMVAAVLLFLVVGRSPSMYALASVTLGCTYGLTLPAVQAGAVNLTAPEHRPRMLPLAGLMFEVAILAFPLAAGAVIASSSYTVIFLVLLGFAILVAALGLREAVLEHGPRLRSTPATATPPSVTPQ